MNRAPFLSLLATCLMMAVGRAGEIDGWAVTYTAQGKLQIERDPATFHSAPDAVRLSSSGGAAKGGASHPLEVAHAPYTISGAIRSAGEVKGAFAVQVFGGGKQLAWIPLQAVSGASDWTAFSKKVELPAGAQSAQCALTLDGEGQIWLDDFKAVPEAPPVEAAALPLAVAANDSLIRYEGRWDTRDAAGPRCSWSASMLHLRFEGTALNLRLKDTGPDEYEVFVDGQPAPKVAAERSTELYHLFTGAAGPHTVTLVKGTEASFGVGQVLGFQLSAGGKLLPLPPRPSRRLEVIGDSISCGYGNEAASEKEHFSPKTENAAMTYGALAARALGAEYVCVAWSGKKMSPNNTMGEYYDRTLALDTSSQWDFTKWIPDAVVINLSTNDFGRAQPDRAEWVADYRKFLERVRGHYPHAQIFCATSPMLWAERNTASREYLRQIVQEENAAGHAEVHYLLIESQNAAKYGLGADWHPSVKTHEVMAQAVEEALRPALGWKEN